MVDVQGRLRQGERYEQIVMYALGINGEWNIKVESANLALSKSDH